MYEKLETFLITYIDVRKVGDIFNNLYKCTKLNIFVVKIWDLSFFDQNVNLHVNTKKNENFQYPYIILLEKFWVLVDLDHRYVKKSDKNPKIGTKRYSF